MKYIPVDQYVSERHFEDCVVPQGVCSVDYIEQYRGNKSKTVKNKKFKLEQKVKEILRNDYK